MKILLSILILSILVFVTPTSVLATDGNLSLFTSETSARQHCPTDIVVWLNIPTGIYHLKGQRWYANTKNGSYVCEKEADNAGDRPSINGQ